MKRLCCSMFAVAVGAMTAAAGCSAEGEITAGDPNADETNAAPAPGAPSSFGGVDIVEAIAAGSGCPDGAEISIDASGLVTVTPPDYRADTTTVHRACILAMSVNVPDGVRLGLADARLAGAADAGAGGTARASVERAFVGEVEDVAEQTFGPGSDGSFELVDDAGVRWSECGDSTIAKVHTALTAQGGAAIEGDAFSVQLIVDDCGAGDPPPSDDPPSDEPPCDDPPSDDPPSDALGAVEITDAIVGGSGCPGGTASIEVSADKRTVSVNASAYAVATGGSLADTRKACIARVAVDVPAGVRLGIASASLAGSADIGAGSGGSVRVEKHFPFGASDVAEAELDAADSGAFTVDNDAGVTWSTCGFVGFVGLDTSLRVTGDDATMHSGGFEATLVAEPCP